MKIARVFAAKTSMCPTDRDCYFGPPPMFVEPYQYDVVFISVTFTWDLERARFLEKQWQRVCRIVKVGGPALDEKGGIFFHGLFMKPGVVITSRGCPSSCPHCFVPDREGKIRELPIAEGNIVQDNNLLACSKEHIDQVFTMLKGQKGIDFPGGLEPGRITDDIVEKLRSVRTHNIWLAYDHENADKPLQKAVEKLKKYFPKWKLRCYVLIGFEDDTIEKAERRLMKAWEIGVFPFAMLYQPKDQVAEKKKYNGAWRKLQKTWCRPALMKVRMGENGDSIQVRAGAENEVEERTRPDSIEDY